MLSRAGRAVAASLLAACLSSPLLSGDHELVPLAVEQKPAEQVPSVFNTGLVTTELARGRGVFLFFADEAFSGPRDLNGDGDTFDRVVMIFDEERQHLFSLRVAVSGGAGISWGWEFDAEILLAVSEESQGADLNGDGDLRDLIWHYWRSGLDQARNLGFTWGLTTGEAGTEKLEHAWSTEGGERPSRVAFPASEYYEGQDFNGDGDLLDTVAMVFDPAQAIIHNTGLQTLTFAWLGRQLGILSSEERQHQDLNGDGDMLDAVVSVLDLDAGTRRTLPLSNAARALPRPGPGLISWGGFWVHQVNEWDPGNVDLNGDGDRSDRVPVLVRNSDLAVVPPFLAIDTTSPPAGDPGPVVPGDGYLAVLVSEARQGATDLDGDGDATGKVLFLLTESPSSRRDSGLAVRNTRTEMHRLRNEVFDRQPIATQGESYLGSDINGDGDLLDDITLIFDPRTGERRALPIAAWPMCSQRDVMILASRERYQGADLNGDGDQSDEIPVLFDGKRLAVQRVASDYPRGLALDLPLVTFYIDEQANGGPDLDGDGRLVSKVPQVVDLESGAYWNIGLPVGTWGPSPAIRGRTLGFGLHEYFVGEDLNGDGDLNDTVLQLVRLPGPASELPAR